MKKTVRLKIDEYIYQFYQKGAKALGRTPEELMEQALFMYAGMVAEDLIQNDEMRTES